MKALTSVRKFIDALLTALGVVFGLRPDPSAVPVEVYTPPTSRSARR